jgi:cytochrome c oxidase subunit IV
MSAHPEALDTENIEAVHIVGTTRLFVVVWVALLALTVVEIGLAYEHVPVNVMLTILVGLSLLKSALIISYFMHLRFERLGLFFLLIPAMVFCISMMLLVFFPDSVRLMNMRPH